MAPALYLAAQHIRADPCRAGLGSCSPAKLPGRCSWNKAAAPSRPQRYHVRGGKTLVNRLRYILTPPLPHARRGLFIPFHPKEEGLKPVCISDGASPAGGHPGLRAPHLPRGPGCPRRPRGAGSSRAPFPPPAPFRRSPSPTKGVGGPEEAAGRSGPHRRRFGRRKGCGSHRDGGARGKRAPHTPVPAVPSTGRGHPVTPDGDGDGDKLDPRTPRPLLRDPHLEAGRAPAPRGARPEPAAAATRCCPPSSSSSPRRREGLPAARPAELPAL